MPREVWMGAYPGAAGTLVAAVLMGRGAYLWFRALVNHADAAARAVVNVRPGEGQTVSC